jgi:formylglycine-generating enzyme required for sulfatase activity
MILTCAKKPTESENSPIIKKVLVDEGTFRMGNTLGNGSRDQIPSHLVTLRAFYLSKYEITHAEYQTIMGENPSSSISDNQPAMMVSWFDAVAFCNALSAREGLTPCYEINGKDITCNFNANGYRLPTEAEWEYAARGGNLSQDYKYSGSNDINRVAWYNLNSGGETHNVGTKLANELGLNDMSGNVWEWCWDWYGLYSDDPQSNPIGPDSGNDRVFRGGNMITHDDYVQIFFRGFHNPSLSGGGVGFRVAQTQ